MAALLTFSLMIAAAASPPAQPLPKSIDTSQWGTPSFIEDFKTFDQGVDQAKPAHPHRWRTVAGHGGPLDPNNRSMSGTSFGSDREFAGVSGGKVGSTPLGLDPFELEPGRSLTITAHRTPSDIVARTWNKPYYGGKITTKFSFSQLFGYFEIEAKLPAGKGMWPAFWLMPVEGTWPQNGELDILEGLGDPHIVFCTVISGKQPQAQKRVTLPFDASASFHRYGAAWGPKEIVWYIDGREVFRTATPADMKTTPMYIIANLAVGGAWGGYPTAETIFPGRYVIKRITAWRLPSAYGG